MLKDKREEKLPRWTQELLRKLRGRIEDDGASLAVYRRETVGKGHITVQESIGEEINLPDHSTITMGTGLNKIHFNYVDNKVRVYAHGELIVEPRAANSVYLRSK